MSLANVCLLQYRSFEVLRPAIVQYMYQFLDKHAVHDHLTLQISQSASVCMCVCVCVWLAKT